MNPLKQVKWTQVINQKALVDIGEDVAWHAKFKDSAYVFVGSIPYDFTDGDLLAVFTQYGEALDVNLVRDKATRKSKGFAFLAYEEQRSTVLAVDNLNGAKVQKKREKNTESAMLSRKASATAELPADIPMMSRITSH